METVLGTAPGDVTLETRKGPTRLECSLRCIGTDPTEIYVGDQLVLGYTRDVGGECYGTPIPASTRMNDAFSVLRGFLAAGRATQTWVTKVTIRGTNAVNFVEPWGTLTFTATSALGGSTELLPEDAVECFAYWALGPLTFDTFTLSLPTTPEIP